MKKVFLSVAVILCFLITGCSDSDISYNNFEVPMQFQSALVPVSSIYTENSYEGVEPTVEATEESFISEDGLCRIDRKKSYYDVTLDYENGSYYDVGYAYGKTILRALPDYESVYEPYLYENIKNVCTNINGDYSFVETRMEAIESTLPDDYRKEIKGFAEGVSDGERGFSENGRLSYEEAVLMHLIPDTLRGTACSAMSVWGDKSKTGSNISARILEWQLGSENQMCSCHCVLHLKNKEKSITSISIIGMLSIISAINDDGVFAGILDVGSGTPYSCEGKKSYVYALRYALENYDTAEDVGKYMVSGSAEFAYSHNITLSDKNGSYCAEDCVNEDKGISILRTSVTPLVKNLFWDNADSLCVVNTFVSQENEFDGSSHNIVRWEKFRNIVSKKEKVSVNDLKSELTCENIDDDNKNGFIFSDNLVHLVIVDYSTGMIQVAFSGTDGIKNHPEFINVGEYR